MSYISLTQVVKLPKKNQKKQLKRDWDYYMQALAPWTRFTPWSTHFPNKGSAAWIFLHSLSSMRVHPAASAQHCIIWKEKYILFTVKKATLTYLPWNYHSTFLPLSSEWAGTWKTKCLQLECSCVLQTLNIIPEEPARQWQAFFLGFQLLR